MGPRVVDIAFQYIAFLFAISIHEAAHAWTAKRLGDPTASMLGRVTLNPRYHIDLIGSVLMPVIAMVAGWVMIGWAKPTPVDPRNFKNKVLDDILTTVAGPVSNFLVAGIAIFGLFLMTRIPGAEAIARLVLASRFGQLNPFEETSILVPIALLLYQFIYLNVLLAIFNLIPIPPLDGSHVLRHFLPEKLLRIYDNLGMWGLVLFFLVGGRILGFFFTPVLTLIDALLLKF